MPARHSFSCQSAKSLHFLAKTTPDSFMKKDNRQSLRRPFRAKEKNWLPVTYTKVGGKNGRACSCSPGLCPGVHGGKKDSSPFILFLATRFSDYSLCKYNLHKYLSQQCGFMVVMRPESSRLYYFSQERRCKAGKALLEMRKIRFEKTDKEWNTGRLAKNYFTLATATRDLGRPLSRKNRSVMLAAASGPAI